ncbi:MAG TPA: HEAT repeat domain-containing protein [Pirellulaceae bacterium]|nr:HEAT repeat domain-containing protein [Pirellulaceae bacterium]
MFGWFKTKCPLATAEKVWVESSMDWLAGTLGIERLIEAELIEPSDEFFPDHYSGQDADAARIFKQVCGLMQIDPAQVRLELCDRIGDDKEDKIVGQYVSGDPATIVVRRSQLADPESLVATLAHELAHEILLGGGFLEENNEDTERLTDLTTVFLGLGIFGANSFLREATVREGRFSTWSIRKQGYLPIRMYGYGLALFAWARDESDPDWAAHLRADAREPFTKGLQFLLETDDSVFRLVDPERHASDEQRFDAAVANLAHRSPSRRMWGLTHLLESNSHAATAIEPIGKLLHDRDTDVRGTAAYVLGTIGPPAAEHVPRLQDLLTSRDSLSREGAAYALGQIRPDDPIVIDDLARVLDDEDARVLAAAASALSNYGPAAAAALPYLLKRYEKSLIRCDYARIDALAAALRAVAPDAIHRVRDHFASDAELRQYAEDCLHESTPSAEPE